MRNQYRCVVVMMEIPIGKQGTNKITPGINVHHHLTPPNSSPEIQPPRRVLTPPLLFSGSKTSAQLQGLGSTTKSMVEHIMGALISSVTLSSGVSTCLPSRLKSILLASMPRTTQRNAHITSLSIPLYPHTRLLSLCRCHTSTYGNTHKSCLSQLLVLNSV